MIIQFIDCHCYPDEPELGFLITFWKHDRGNAGKVLSCHHYHSPTAESILRLSSVVKDMNLHIEPAATCFGWTAERPIEKKRKGISGGRL